MSVLDDIEQCPECLGPTTNENEICAGAIANDIDQGGCPILDARGLQDCNCCDECRLACHMSYQDQMEEESNWPRDKEGNLLP